MDVRRGNIFSLLDDDEPEIVTPVKQSKPAVQASVAVKKDSKSLKPSEKKPVKVEAAKPESEVKVERNTKKVEKNASDDRSRKLEEEQR